MFDKIKMRRGRQWYVNKGKKAMVLSIKVEPYWNVKNEATNSFVSPNALK